MMKKLCILLALCLTLAMLAGCGGGNDATEPPTTETVTEAPTDASTEPPTEAATEPLPAVVNWHFTEPEGFTAVSSNGNIGILAGPDGDGTSITVMTLETTVDFSEVTEDNFAGILGVLGDEDTETVLNGMEAMEIDGYPAYLMDYTMTTSGITARYRAYYVSAGDCTYVFIFADATADGAWEDAFAASAATINMLQEGEIIPADTTGLASYDLGCGLSMYAAPGMELVEQEGFQACLADYDRLVMVIEDSKAEFGLYGLSLEDYASLYVDGETITGFESDPYGNLSTYFVNEGADGVMYIYYVTVKNTADSFWLVQCACAQEAAALYYEDFALWCATITETP